MSTRAVADARQRRRWKSALRWLHLWTGALVSLIVLTVGVSGLALAFVSTIFAWETGALTPPSDSGAPAKPVGEMVDAAVEHFEGAFEPLGVLMPYSRLEVGAAMIYGFPEPVSADPPTLIVGVDPATGAVLGSFDLYRSFGHLLLDFHQELLIGEIGAVLVAVVGLVTIALAISGLVLWWPARGMFARQLSRDLSVAVRRPSHFSLHRTLGVCGGIAILLWGLSGAYWSKPGWFAPFVNEEWEEIPADQAARFEAQCEGTVTPTEAQQTAEHAFPGLEVSQIVFAGRFFDHHRLAMKDVRSLDRYFGDTHVWVHASCPGVFHANRVADQGYAEMAAHMAPSLHSGRLFGAAGIPVVLMVGAATVVAGVTGIVLWSRRYVTRPSWRKRPGESL